MDDSTLTLKVGMTIVSFLQEHIDTREEAAGILATLLLALSHGPKEAIGLVTALSELVIEEMGEDFFEWQTPVGTKSTTTH